MPKTQVTKNELIVICEQKLPSESFYTSDMRVSDIQRLPSGYRVEILVSDSASVLNVLQGQHFSQWVSDNFDVTDL
ncbi:hypothetical protein HNP55_002079 [Paucibacter oligotrophus]|uniref:Uncharacterized protein n=1 Tax=Roseateles oligotrophus TaxID=1769250 RepID=A0A840L6A1_9BURK|nr:hypothetical protein [Roseateles oligotrophus]MBB4843556.1 hypothetical protein [Roseateles oligotrophus]